MASGLPGAPTGTDEDLAAMVGHLTERVQALELRLHMAEAIIEALRPRVMVHEAFVRRQMDGSS